MASINVINHKALIALHRIKSLRLRMVCRIFYSVICMDVCVCCVRVNGFRSSSGSSSSSARHRNQIGNQKCVLLPSHMCLCQQTIELRTTRSTSVSSSHVHSLSFRFGRLTQFSIPFRSFVRLFGRPCVREFFLFYFFFIFQFHLICRVPGSTAWLVEGMRQKQFSVEFEPFLRNHIISTVQSIDQAI